MKDCYLQPSPIIQMLNDIIIQIILSSCLGLQAAPAYVIHHISVISRQTNLVGVSNRAYKLPAYKILDFSTLSR